MKNLLYLIFAFVYYLCSLFKTNSNKIVFIMTHDRTLDGNIGYIFKSLKEKEYNLEYHFITKEDYSLKLSLKALVKIFKFFIIKPYQLATAKYVFLDNVFLPFAYIKFKKDVKIVQLWHGSGTIKKFGQDVNKGRLAKLEKLANCNYTHLVVNSTSIIDTYASAFKISKDIIFPVGCPRTDFFFNKKAMSKNKEEFYSIFPELKNFKLILYAPTFRDHEMNNPKINIDVDEISTRLGKDYILLMRLHPFIASKIKVNNSANQTIINVSDYKDLNTLLVVADVLITDYSSIIFEYALTRRPIIFYPYDLELYENKLRGFYNIYKDYVPGPIVYNTKELIDMVFNDNFNYQKLDQFISNNYDHFDGKSTERVVNLIFEEIEETGYEEVAKA